MNQTHFADISCRADTSLPLLTTVPAVPYADNFEQIRSQVSGVQCVGLPAELVGRFGLHMVAHQGPCSTLSATRSRAGKLRCIVTGCGEGTVNAARGHSN